MATPIPNPYISDDMKIAINVQHGGFGLSPKGIALLHEKKGMPCYFFSNRLDTQDQPLTLAQAESERLWGWMCYTVPNPQDYNLDQCDEDGRYVEANKRAQEIGAFDYENNRSDADLVAVIEELGDAANSRFAKLKVVEIPDGVDYIIEEYDGLEHIAEKHRTWS